jgi:hypothetical protein
VAEELLERFAKLEAKLEALHKTAAEDERRQFDDLRGQFAHWRDVTKALDARLIDLEKRQDAFAAELRELVSQATKRADGCADDLKSTGEIILDHLKKLEADRRADAQKAERTRSEAAGRHAARFNAQGVALEGTVKAVTQLQTVVTENRKTLRILIAAVAALTIASGGAQVIKALSPSTTWEAPR